jgi:RNA-binding protein
MIKSKKQLKDEGKQLDPTIRIGKSGLSEGTLSEISKQLNSKKIIKIKFLNNYIYGKDKKEEIQKITDATNSELIEVKGSVFLIYRAKKN